jgi:5-oxopent-3-ene-1,2,5-tricarboxylate decarboxylase/2-hydroxyhepta-2,4-diene-1,7-dioate isomerase
LIFAFASLVADLSRFFTLEPGDIILTGTPGGGGVLEPGDVVEVELVGLSKVRSEVVESKSPVESYGAMPSATPESRAYAFGSNSSRPVTLTPEAKEMLHAVSTATLTAQLARRGIYGTFLTGLRPSKRDASMVGYARTLRYGALREDIRDQSRTGNDAQKGTIETISLDDVLVIEARGETGAGTIGDILAARALARGAAGIVTDGGARDTPGLAGLSIPIYYRLAHASSLWTKHVPLDADVTVTCAGVLVVPGDVIVGDAEGVVVIPAALAEELARDAREQETREAFALERVQNGAALRGLYPLTDELREDFELWRNGRDQAKEKRQ